MDGLLIDTEPLWFSVETRDPRTNSVRSGCPTITRSLVGSALPVAVGSSLPSAQAGRSRPSRLPSSCYSSACANRLRHAPVLSRESAICIAELDARRHSARVGVVVVSSARRSGARRRGATDVRHRCRRRRGVARTSRTPSRICWCVQYWASTRPTASRSRIRRAALLGECGRLLRHRGSERGAHRARTRAGSCGRARLPTSISNILRSLFD